MSDASIQKCATCGFSGKADQFRSVNQCKRCNYARQKLWVNQNRLRRYALNKRYPQKRLARKRLEYAIISGRVTRPSHCSDCGKHCKPHGHHDDYSRPLDVRWLCSICHGKVHRIKAVA